MTTLLLLYFEFFKIGLFAIGGGLATLPFLINLASSHPDWLTMQDVSNMIAVSESTPGPMGINMATYVGNNVGNMVFGNGAGGVLGGILATLGEITPSLIIIMIIAGILAKFQENKYVKWAFYGLRATTIALISYAACQVYKVALLKGSEPKFPALILFILLLACMIKYKKVHPVVWIAIAAVIGIISPMFGFSFL